MNALFPVRCAALLVALTTAGCAEVFGVELPPALSNAGASTLYDGTARPALTWPEVREPPETREVRGPAVVVIKVPAGASVTVNWVQTAPPLYAPRPYRPASSEEAPIPAPYKPSPYEPPPPPASLYRMD